MKYIVVYIAMFIALGASAQIASDNELSQKLEGKTSFYEIQKIVSDYYKEKKQALSTTDVKKRKGFERQEKFWNRWFYENESRLSPDGKIVNTAAKTWEAIQHKQQKTNNSQARSAFGSWELMGPTFNSSGIGRVNRLAFDPVSPNTVYAGTATGGIWRTTNNGSSWTALSNFIPSLGISGIVVSHNNPSEIYILTGDGDANNNRGLTFKWGYAKPSIGVLKSTDGGATWFRTGKFRRGDGTFRNDDARYFGLNLVQCPVLANTLIAATDSGLYRTTDGGLNWNQCMVGGFSNDIYFDVVFKPGSSLEVYATGANGFFKSNDGGVNFTQLNIPEFFDNGANISGRIKIAVTAANPSLVYLLAGPGFQTKENDNDTYLGFFRSLNSGASFTRRHNTPDLLAYKDVINTIPSQSAYDLALAANPADANMAITGGLVAWRTLNGGTSFSEVVDYFEDADPSNYIHADIHDLAYNPLNGSLWAATDGGVAHSIDNGTNWNQHFNFPISQFYHFEPTNDDDFIWGGSQDNGVQEQSSIGSTIFDEYAGGDGYAVLTDNDNRDDIYYGVNKDIYADAFGFDENITPNGVDEFFPLLAMHPSDEDIIYAGYSRLFISQDKGSSWSSFLFSGDTISGQWALTTCPSNGQRVYAAGRKAGSRRLWRINNATTATPEVIDLTPNVSSINLWMGNNKITDLAVSPINSNIITITIGGYRNDEKVLHSDDGGITWVNWSYNLPNVPVNTVITDGAGNMYIGTDIGVYYSNNSIAGWQPFYNNLPPVPVSELAFHTEAGKQFVYAATYGRGIWRSELFENCQADLTVNQALQGPKFFQASNSISSAATLSGGSGTVVNYQSGNEITLQPGFSAEFGNEFSTRMAPCNSGLPLNMQLETAIDPGTGKSRAFSKHYLYGKIKNIFDNGNELKVDLKVNKPGLYKLVVTDAEGGNAVNLHADEITSAGLHTIQIDKNRLTSGSFMLQLYYKEALVHMQEIHP